MEKKLRPIDKSLKETQSWIKSSLVFINKKEIKTWQGIFVIAFMAGIFVTLAFTISSGIHPFSQAAKMAEDECVAEPGGGSFSSPTQVNIKCGRLVTRATYYWDYRYPQEVEKKNNRFSGTTTYDARGIKVLRIYGMATDKKGNNEKYFNRTYIFKPSNACYDSDGGINYNYKGTVRINDGSGYGYYGYGGSETYTDECQNKKRLLEYFCNSEGDVGKETKSCTKGCEDGACNVDYELAMKIKHSGTIATPNDPGVLEYGDISLMQGYAAEGRVFKVKAKVEHYPNNTQYNLPIENFEDFSCNSYDYNPKQPSSSYGGWIECSKISYELIDNYYDEVKFHFSIPIASPYHGNIGVGQSDLYKDGVYRVSDSLFVKEMHVYIEKR